MGATTKKTDLTFRNAEFIMGNPEQELKNHNDCEEVHYNDNSENNCSAE